MKLSPRRLLIATLMAVGAAALPGCGASTSDQLSEPEAHAHSVAARDGAIEATNAVLAAAGVDATQPLEEQEIDGCSAVDYSFESYGQWWLFAAVPLDPGTEVTVINQLSARLALDSMWNVIGDEPGEQAPESATERYLWSADTANDLSVDVTVDLTSHVLNVRTRSDCYITRSN